MNTIIKGKFCKLICRVHSCAGCDFWVPQVGCFLYTHKNMVDPEQLKANERVQMYR